MSNAEQKPSEMNADELPNEVAFQDEFTRDFMKSTEEVDDGLYWFESGTGKYEMLIPGGLRISPDSYSTQRNDNAEFFLSSTDSESKLIAEIQMRFLSFTQPESAHESVDRLKEQESELIWNNHVEKVEKEDKDIYIMKSELADLEKTNDYIFFILYIQNKNGIGSAEISYTTFCEDRTADECEELYQQHEAYITKLIDEFKFINSEEDSHE